MMDKKPMPMKRDMPMPNSPMPPKEMPKSGGPMPRDMHKTVPPKYVPKKK